VPEQQRESSDERGAVRGQGHGRSDVRRRRRPSSVPPSAPQPPSLSAAAPPALVRHAAIGDENEIETVEKVQLDGLGRRVATGLARHFAAAHLHRRQQSRTTAQGAPRGAEEAVQHNAKQLSEEFAIPQVSGLSSSILIV